MTALSRFALFALCAAAAPVYAQSTLVGPVVNAVGSVAIDIEQSGAASLGSATDPLTLSGTGSGSLVLTVRQAVTCSSACTPSLIQAYTAGAGLSQVTLEQRTSANEAVDHVWAQILLGTQTAAQTQNVTLKQQGDGAWASIVSTDGDNLSAYIVQGQGTSVTIANSGAGNTYGTAGVPIGVYGAAGLTTALSIANTGANNSFAVTQAAGSTVGITNTGNANTYSIATQQAGDALALGINGSNNSFTFDFNAYQQVSWTVGAAAPVNGGNFQVAPIGNNWYVYDAATNASNQNITAAANATVTKR